MVVRVEFVGLPELRKAAGAREISLDLKEPTLGGLLKELEERHGFIARNNLMSTDGRQVQQSIQVLKNGSEWLSREDLGTPLRSGDKITFMLMVAGG